MIPAIFFAELPTERRGTKPVDCFLYLAPIELFFSVENYELVHEISSDLGYNTN